MLWFTGYMLTSDWVCTVRVRPRSVSASEGMGCPDAVRRLRRGREAGSPVETSPSRLFFDPVEIESVRTYLPTPLSVMCLNIDDSDTCRFLLDRRPPTDSAASAWAPTALLPHVLSWQDTRRRVSRRPLGT